MVMTGELFDRGRVSRAMDSLSSPLASIPIKTNSNRPAAGLMQAKDAISCSLVGLHVKTPHRYLTLLAVPFEFDSATWRSSILTVVRAADMFLAWMVACPDRVPSLDSGLNPNIPRQVQCLLGA